MTLILSVVLTIICTIGIAFNGYTIFVIFLTRQVSFFALFAWKQNNLQETCKIEELFTKNSMIKNVIRFVCSVGEMNFTNDC